MNYLEYKGDKLPVRISYFAVSQFQAETKKSLNEVANDLALLEPLLWYGLQAGHKAEGKDLKVKREDVVWILDECFSSFMQIFADQNSIKKK